MFKRKINLIQIVTQIRSINTTTCCLSTNIKQVKVMKKIMAGREKGKRRWMYNENLPKMENPNKLGSTLNQGKEANRRVTVLNKLFMKNVTDLMATDLFAEDLFGFGLQISTVKVDADFKKMNIFWVASDMRENGKIEKILKSIAGPIRHELSVLRLMGEVPQINFVKDRRHMKTAEIDAALKFADFGEDFIPTDPTLFLKTEPTLELRISDEQRKQIKELDKLPLNEDETEEFEMPIMRNDTFGLDQAKIMNRIVASLSKSKQAWHNFENDKETTSPTLNPPTATSMNLEIDKLVKEAEMREHFVKFLETRQLQRKYTPERKKHKVLLSDEFTDESIKEYQDSIPDDDFLEDEDANKI